MDADSAYGANSHNITVQVDGSPTSFSLAVGWGSEGSGSDGTPVSLHITSTGAVSAGNGGTIAEGTNDDGYGNFSGLHTINTDQHAIANDLVSVVASGDEISLSSSGSSVGSGWASTTAAGVLGIDSIQGSVWGMTKH